MKTPFTFKLILAILTLTTFTSCNKDFPKPKRKVVIEILTQSTALPGEVSIFFKVEDKKNGTPIAGLESSDFIIYEQGPNDEKYRVISASEASSNIVADNQNFVFNTMLVLDLSASVTSNNLADLKASTITFVNEFMPAQATSSTRMGVWWFDGDQNLHELHDFTSYKDSLIASINAISTSISSDNSTNLYGAVMQAADISDSTSQFYTAQNIINSSAITIFTDGTDQANWNSQLDATSAIATLNDDTKVLTIGLGDEIDKDILKDLGVNGFVFAKNPSKLNEKFSEIANHISDLANSYYLFQYCSPKRSGSNIKLMLKIKGKVDKKNHRGSVETSFDATGFTGC